MRWLLALGAVAAAACSPFSQRPRLDPLPLSPSVEVKGKRPAVTEKTMQALAEDGMPLAHRTTTDAYAESAWLDSATMQATSRRPVGMDVVKLRTWIDPSRPGFSRVTIEPVYRPTADPSVPERELDRLVPETHPAWRRAQALLEKLGGKPMVVPAEGPPVTPQPAAAPAPPAGDTVTVPPRP
ncbi:MAG TPA: hypothetical protein VFY20_03330 [Gemmatimonadales bacterium]|nr:hypothetical protein [Gemmatimonadales bacterium]